MKKVSIVVPVYNAEKFIEDGINCALKQSYQNFELILVNDGSTDNTLEILNKFKNNKKIKIFNKENGGVYSARNYGIKEATGDYLTFLDADDYFDQDFLQTMVDNIEDNDILIAGYKQVDVNHNLIFDRNKILSKYRQMVIWSKLYNMEFIKKNNLLFEPIKICEDIDFSLTAYSKANKIKCISYSGYNCVRNEGSLSNDAKIKKDFDITSVIRKISKIVDNNTKFIKEDKKELEFFFIKLFTNYLCVKSEYLEYKELKKYFFENMDYLKEYYKKNKMRLGINHNSKESFMVNASVNLVVILYKLHLGSLAVRIFRFRGKHQN